MLQVIKVESFSTFLMGVIVIHNKMYKISVIKFLKFILRHLKIFK